MNIIHDLNNKYHNIPFKCSNVFKQDLSELAKELSANDYTDSMGNNDDTAIDLVVYDQTSDVEFHG